MTRNAMFAPRHSKDWSMYLAGSWDSDGARRFEVVNPATEAMIAQMPEATEAQIDKAVSCAREVADSGAWSSMLPNDKKRILTQIADGLAKRADDLTAAVVAETGFPVSLARPYQVDLGIYDMYAWAEATARPTEVPLPKWQSPAGGLASSIAVREPHGVSLIIATWNFPLFQITRKLGPALVMGNSVIVKASPHGTLTALILAEVISETDLPKGTVQFVTGESAATGEKLVSHPGVDHVSFTGSTAVGRRVMQQAAASLKRVTLELGGKSPNVLLEDADLSQALPMAFGEIALHSGQVCTAMTRLIVPRKLQDKCIAEMVSMAKNAKVGKPTDADTQMGPLISAAQHKRVGEIVHSAVQEGADLCCGGKSFALDGKGYYFAPTIIGNVKSKMRVAQEEIFGPVLSVLPYDSVDEAVTLANDSIYGLWGAVWSRNTGRAFEVARRLRTGTVGINGGAFNTQAPFGGYKQSGIGRENGAWSLDEYSELKHIAWTS